MDGHLYERECEAAGADEALTHLVPEEIVVERMIRTHHGLMDYGSSHQPWRMAA